MAQQSTIAQTKVKKVMHEFKDGTLKSSSGDKVTSRKQAIAIGLSEARDAGARIPPKPAPKSAPKSGSKRRSSTTSHTQH